LGNIFLKYGTDKGPTGHGYERVYDREFAPFRDKPITFLEIGVQEGPSMSSWQEYFTNYTRIIGVSHDNGQTEPIIKNESTRVTIFLGDQENPSFCQSICKYVVDSGFEALDIVVDDGSHVPPHQITSFTELIRCVRPGGLYIIEDIETSYWNKPGAGLYGYTLKDVGVYRPGSVIESFKKVIDVINRKYMLNSAFSVIVSDQLVCGISFYQNSIVMRRCTEVDNRSPHNHDYYGFGDRFCLKQP